MSVKKIARQSLGGLLATSATLSVGFLSFAGMFVLSPSIWLCGGALVLAMAYEGQVNSEGISSALKRIFGKNYLKRGIIRQFLQDQAAVNPVSNLFLIEYLKQQEYLERLDKLDDLTEEQVIKRKAIKKRLMKMEMFLLKRLEHPDLPVQTQMETQAAELIVNERQTLLAEIKRKKWQIRLSWPFALGGGICSGLATLSAMKAGIAVFSVLSAVPGGILIALSLSAAIGYALLLYQSISDMVQNSRKFMDAFKQRKDKDEESTLGYALKCIGFGLAIGLAIFATVATAGTWWYAAKQGGAILSLGERAASMVRSISLGLMTLPLAIFGSANSIESVDKISRSHFQALHQYNINYIKCVWLAENKNLLRFLNPFRLVEKILIYTAKTLFFLGHLVSTGLISDRLNKVPASVCVGAITVGEGLTHANYLPGEKTHHHASLLLSALFFPVTIAVTVLKMCALVWDLPFSRNVKESYESMFPVERQETVAQEPNVAQSWRKQEFIEVCDGIVTRLENESAAKVNAANQVKTLLLSDVEQPDAVQQTALRTAAQPLAANRFNFWQKQQTQSQKDFDEGFQQYWAPVP